MKLKKVLIIHKKSLFSKLKAEGELPRIQKLVLKKQKYSHRIYLSHSEHKKTLDVVIQSLKNACIKYSCITRGSVKSIEGYDLVVTVGGDGTFLYASHFIFNTPMLGVNSSPSCSRGVFCNSNYLNFDSKINSILKDNINRIKLYRLNLFINNKKIGIPVLNDILFSNEEPAGTSRYVISINELAEEHYSSGVWISTASGSTGAIRSAGGSVIDLTSKEVQFKVREILRKKGEMFNLVQCTLNENSEINFLSKMKRGLISIDGHNLKIKVTLGDKITVKGGTNPLTVFGINESVRDEFALDPRFRGDDKT